MSCMLPAGEDHQFSPQHWTRQRVHRYFVPRLHSEVTLSTFLQTNFSSGKSSNRPSQTHLEDSDTGQEVRQATKTRSTYAEHQKYVTSELMINHKNTPLVVLLDLWAGRVSRCKRQPTSSNSGSAEPKLICNFWVFCHPLRGKQTRERYHIPQLYVSRTVLTESKFLNNI